MANLERRPNQDISPNIDPIKLPSPEESLDAISELVEDFQPKDIFKHKEKGLPSLQAKLEEIYTGEDREKRASLDVLHEDVVQRTKLKQILKEALDDRRGCRWKLDGFTYGPSIIVMSLELLGNSANIHTLYHGGGLIAAMVGIRLFGELAIYPEGNDPNKENHRTSYREFELKDLKVIETGKKLSHQEKIIRKSLEMLQLHEMQDNHRKEYDAFETTLSDITHFYEEKKLEEELLKRARERLQSE